MIELMPEQRAIEAKMFVMAQVGLGAPASLVTALGFMDSATKKLVGAWAFERCTGEGGSVYVHWATAAPGWLNRDTLALISHYVFEQLGCAQALGEVRASDTRTRSINERLGFKKVGEIPGYFPNDDLILYCMRRSDCIWLPAEDENDG